MRIGLEALKSRSRQASGIENYLNNLWRGFEEIGAAENIKRYTSPLILSESFTRNFILPPFINHDRMELIHFPDHILPLWPIRAKTVITVHDLAFVKYPQFYNFTKRWYKNLLAPSSINRADKIIAVSQTTKRDLIGQYDIPEDKIKVIYNGVADKFKPLDLGEAEKERRKKKYSFKRFLLFVGTIEPRKNLKGLIESFSEISKKEPDLGLVICGKLGWLTGDILNAMSKHPNILYLKYVSDEDLVELYNLAEIFVYPSFYEGFGFPPLEAMACGTPVIAGRTSSLPEVLGEAAWFIDPQDPRQIAQAIEKLLNDLGLCQNMIEKGFKQARTFTWKKTAEATWKLYQEMIKHGR